MNSPDPINTFDWTTFKGPQKWIEQSTILMVKSGSVAYGTTVEQSDVDHKGVAVGLRRHYHGFLEPFDHIEQTKPDLSIFEIRKFFRLAQKGSPAALEILFTPDELVVQQSLCGSILRENRHAFLSKNILQPYLGYAKSQFKMITQQYQTKLSYNTKPAYHLVRSLRCCTEMLQTHNLLVQRPDAEQLVQIRRGAWSYEQLAHFYEQTTSLINQLALTTSLVGQPNILKLEQLCQEIIYLHDPK